MPPPPTRPESPPSDEPAIRAESIPAELTALPQWVCWRMVTRNDKGTKVPFRADRPGAEASTTDRATWSGFAPALAAFLEPENRLDGIGFVFTADDPFVGVDLDNAMTRDGHGDALASWAREILDMVPGYVELTPSGRGLHIITRGECPGGKGRRRGGLMPAGGGVECYDRGRYFTFTGHVFEGRREVARSERPFAEIHGELFPSRTDRPRPAAAPPAAAGGDAEILRGAMNARNGAKFARLWSGDRSGYPSPSEADLALCSCLSFYTQDPATIDRLFRLSGLASGKWADRADYRESTIARALERSEVYSPRDLCISSINCINPGGAGLEGGSPGNKCNKSNYGNNPGDTPACACATDPGAAADPEAWPPPVLDGPEPSMPFPVGAFPAALQDFLAAVAEAIACPVDYVATAALGMAGGAMGRSVAVRLKEGWYETPGLFAAIVGDPGMAKSPVLSTLARPLWDITHAQLRAHTLRLDLHRRTAKKDDPPPDPPRRVIVDDATVEALSCLLQENPRGLVMVKDELSGLFSGLNQYKAGGKGNDRQFFLSAWSGSSVAVDRKGSADRRPIHVSHPCLSIVGGLTPDMLGEMGEGKGRDDGFLDRILFAFPDRVRVRWTDRGVPPELAARWSEALAALWSTGMAADDEGRPRPWFVGLGPLAAEAYREWFDRHEAESESDNFPGYLRGPWAKYRAYAARLALVVDRLGHAFGEGGHAPGDVSADSWSGAARLVDYFKCQTRRVRALMRGSFGDSPDGRAVLRWARSTGRPSFGAAEARHNFRRRFPVEGPELDRALAWLAARHCVRPAMPAAARHGPGRKPSPEYEVNPALLGDMRGDD